MRLCSLLVDRHPKHQSATSCKKPRCWRPTAWIPIPARSLRSPVYGRPASYCFRVAVMLKCVLPSRMCPGIRPSSPLPHLVLWCSRETNESISSNGEPNVGRAPPLGQKQHAHLSSSCRCGWINPRLRAFIFPDLSCWLVHCC